MTVAKLVKRHNGYFQIWAMPCGHEVRVNTEAEGFDRRNAARAHTLDARTKARLTTAAQCPTCRGIDTSHLDD